jgi:hypothetical protein
MARRVGIGQTTTSQIWRAFGLRPQRADSKLSSDPASQGVRRGGPLGVARPDLVVADYHLIEEQPSCVLLAKDQHHDDR